MTVTTDEDLRTQADAVLRRLVGREDAQLRTDQWTAIRALVADRARALVVQRTGWGKSAVYFVATALLRERGAGPTVIVSPLLSLMRNQVDAARRAGIRAETMNSANVTEWDEVRRRVQDGETDVLLVSPERLNNPGFRDEVLPRLAESAGLVVVDEAHCVSDWGHDFRPDYRRIRTLLEDLPTGTPVLATTATANARVTADVAEQLEHGDGREVLVLRGPLDRESLHLAVRTLPDHAAQMAWLVANLPLLPGSGIVYCLTVAAAEQVAAHLRSAGMEVRSYTGQTDAAERLACESDLLENRVKALVATSALGMGFDKPDLGFVVHVGAPSSPIAYYQQVGRAGRATEHARVVLLPGRDDSAIWDWFASMSFPSPEAVRGTLAALGEAGRPLSTAALETHVDLRRGRLELMLKVLDVDGAVRRVRGGWEATGEPWTYDEERYARVAATRREEQDLVREYVRTEGCRMAFLRRVLDDPLLADDPGWRCGRCDRCGGAPEDVAPAEGLVDAARAGLAVPGTDVGARRQWPSGMSALGVALSGKVAEGERAEDGRAVARLDGLGWGTLLRELFAAGAPDGPLPPALRTPVLEVLDAWAPDVAGVVAVASASRPTLVEHLAGGVARHLGVPLVGAIVPEEGAPPGRHDVNSAQRLADVHRRLALGLSEPALAGLAGRRVLLVDDRTGTGWTLTVAARLLRRAGAAAVLPFVLGVGS
ncbi:RecQ family ATP-dependent DNA helicase [Cellulomonas endophytica]|uniref:RecQ family ATP-dependent DNA helicase n=1 Tax=Cellulomonas endophytica TaxID=2494735 RepID=UPI001011AE8C|nr:RecQ family ATP-dependent DNA helicase [Cellulomonas endophytica]